MRFARDANFNRYVILEGDAVIGYVFGRNGLWRAYRNPAGIVREGRTRDIAARRLVAATTGKGTR